MVLSDDNFATIVAVSAPYFSSIGFSSPVPSSSNVPVSCLGCC